MATNILLNLNGLTEKYMDLLGKLTNVCRTSKIIILSLTFSYLIEFISDQITLARVD